MDSSAAYVLLCYSFFFLKKMLVLFRFTFFIFSTACFLAYLFVTYFVPETANVALEEIDAVFRSAASGEDLALKREVRFDVCLRCRVVIYYPFFAD